MGDFWGDIVSQRTIRADRERAQNLVGNDDEAVVDLGKTSSNIHTNFEKEELESHRAVYVGVHVPLGKQSRRRHRHRGHKHHRKRRDRSSDREDGRESPNYDTPSQRVQFILGTEDDDEEHIPHDLFTELDELSFRDGDNQEWKETARWLKFEEDVEDGGERWSKPYVATLSLHSLFELRSCILNGTVMLDMRANTIDEIADMVIDSMVASGQLEEGVRQKVREALLKRHHHQSEKKLSNRIPLVRSFADIGKKHSDPHLLERNGEGFSASRLSLHRQASTTSSCNITTPPHSPCVFWGPAATSTTTSTSTTSSCNITTPPPSPCASGVFWGPAATSTTTSTSTTSSRNITTPPPSPCASGVFWGPTTSTTTSTSSPSSPSSPHDNPHSTPPAARRHSSACRPSPPRLPPAPDAPLIRSPSRRFSAPDTLPGTREQRGRPGIPRVVVFPPEEELQEEDLSRLLLPSAKQGLLASPQSAPGNLDNSKHSESRINGGGSGSRENSTVDFSKVDMNFMKKIPPGAEASNVLVGEVNFLERPIIAFVRLAPAVLLTGLTEVPVPTRFLFLLLGPFGKGPQYHEIGRSIATLMTDEIFHDVAYKAKDRTDLLSGIDEFLDQVTVLPPGEWDPTIRIEPPKSVPSQEKRKMPALPNGSAQPSESAKEEDHQPGPELQRTGMIFGGLVMDVKRKIPFLWSDIRDAVSLQCLASVLFLYCACMSPVITFGGLLGEATKGNISAIESLFGASLTGVAYSMFSGQPLTILGSTGPVLVFEKILFKFCSEYGLSYLSLRTSIGLWTAFLCLVLVATDASSLVCYITRFTEEAFASLICIIFIYEALEKLVHLGESYPIDMNSHLDNLTFYTCQCSPPVNASAEVLNIGNSSGLTPETISWSDLDVQECKRLRGSFVGPACVVDPLYGHEGPYIPDVLFWSVILFFTTFFLSSFLKQFKTKRYFPTKVRSTISDFAVFLTIMIMVLLDYLVGVPSPKLNVPDRFEPTSKNRGWLISPLGTNPWWTLLAASIPALLCTILIFMDQQITAVIINRKENRLKKGCGYHLDLLVVSLMLGVCSVMGLPWFVAATVLSISHVNSLKLESECAAPGEQPKFLGIREQRVTGFMIFILMGCSVFMTSVLKFIPMPVLYGVFLYMGASSLKGIQLFDRIKLFGMPAKHQPDLIYLRYVPLWKVHIFTLVQLTCLILLWVIKASAAAVVFPMMVLALVFIRKLLDFGFTKRELSWLDDLIPESKKKKEDDKKKREKEEAQRMLDETEAEDRPYELQNAIKGHKGSGDPSVVNISDEMAKTAMWNSLAMNAESGKAPKPSPSQERVSCVQITLEDEEGEKVVDAESSL